MDELGIIAFMQRTWCILIQLGDNYICAGVSRAEKNLLLFRDWTQRISMGTALTGEMLMVFMPAENPNRRTERHPYTI